VNSKQKLTASDYKLCKSIKRQAGARWHAEVRRRWDSWCGLKVKRLG